MTAVISEVSQPHSFGSLLRHYRRERKQSQEVLAERAGLSVRGIADLERGARRFPYAETVERLAAALNLSANERETLEVSRRRPSIPRREVHPVAATPRHNLPDNPHALIGRDTDLAWVRQHFANQDVRLLSLTGGGGVGKTRLAVALGQSLLSEFPDGVWLADMTTGTDVSGATDDLGHSIRRAFGNDLTTWLRSARALLVLDGCEFAIANCAEFARTLLRQSPTVRLVTTGRQPLGIAGEVVWRVPPLSSWEAGADAPGVRLFIEYARARDASFKATETDVAILAAISGRLEGIPLAIQLAAGRSPILTPAQILDRLSDPLALLSAGNQSLPTRHQSMRSSLDWSYQMLTNAERCLLDKLSVFNSFTLDEVEALGERTGGEELLTTLSGLMDKSMLTGQPRDGKMRYQLPVLVRQYARERHRGRKPGDVVHVASVRPDRRLPHRLALAHVE